ncbi:MAG: VWA domain-containing protein [Acidimicrobiaceae bacterium]|jgi:uncharacterized protein|nr:VWA domain-containing protein [Acidimicrobiaceae bacterium]MCH9804665.1 VWA domain-containing protein [bacterium]MDB9845994.1 VWA domain-containing protein [Acidimicrobiales bacterium]MCO4835532.1 VWA domain-containing protein [Acidimicrobiaceae bacterium]MDC3300189.1 VWA domain-containing protein [Acidimicrobiales bacterium]
MTTELFAAEAMADPLLDLMGGFIQELRDAGLPVSLTENLDAMEAVRAIPIEDRTTFKYALGATLVKSHQHWPAFETVFDVYFSIRGPEYSLTNDDDPDGQGEGEGEDGQENDQAEGSGSEAGGGGGDAMSNEDLAEMLYQALMRQDQNLQRAVARTAVQRFAGMEPGRPVGGTYYLYRTLRNLDLDGVLERLLEADRENNEGRSGLDDRLAKDEYESRIEKLKTEIEAEIRRRLVADRGVEAMAKTLRKPLPEDLDFMHATRDEMETLRKAIAPLTRKLAIRLARKRRHKNKGGLDFRNTIRRSLSYGGVPAEPRFKHPRPSKPEIVILADISGSVAAFARFTLHLVYAMSGQFSKVRAFVFIDGLDEVTRFFDGHEDITAAVHRVNTEADVVWVDGHSDYGHAFEVFEKNYLKTAITSKTTVMILGDARNNYHAAQSWIIQEMKRTAKQVFWLNPEPGSYWDTGDSIVSEYAQYCDGLFEVRNLRQLETFIEAVL